MPHGRLPEAAEASRQQDEDCAALLRSLRRCRSSQQLTTIVVLCLPVLVSAQVAAGPRDALQMKMRSVNERIYPCRDKDGAEYTTSRLDARCMENEKIVIDSQHRMLAFCQIRDTTGARRSEILKEVFPDQEVKGATKLIEEANYFVWNKKQTIRECIFPSEIGQLRNEDFMNVIQHALFGEASPGMCSLVADKLCAALGGDPTNMGHIPISECCQLSELPNSWAIESPELFQAWCGSGYRSGNEQCDDADLSEECNTDWFQCPPVTPGEDPKQLRQNDGCNRFCETESYFGWVCTPRPTIHGFGGPTPDRCACNCDCDFKCTCQDPHQRRLCRVDAFGIQTDADNPDIQIACCNAL